MGVNQHGFMVSWFHGFMVSWFHGFMVSWFHGWSDANIRMGYVVSFWQYFTNNHDLHPILVIAGLLEWAPQQGGNSGL